ncbi:MAG: zinc metallopeptidase [Gammaproteobacteria bacterium SHHR-1]|uniref:zinc metallopeptidase n=1 Tax=Magnetovirga frankeli TaxID=947516 RepID=UPI001293DE57|nr:zinc metallopeptidase [gamma proteobacterium SS-5]
MLWLVLLGLLGLLILGPQLWVRWVLNRYNQRPEPNFPGSGGELARHLLGRFQLDQVAVEVTDRGDHYDPASKAVRLSADNLSGRTLTAIATAAHEVGHALQDAAGYTPFRLRQRLVTLALLAQQLGSFMLFIAPLLAVLSRAPVVGLLTALGALLVMTANLAVHLLTLPVELNASFQRALPMLLQGNYISPQQEPAVRSILRACALSYVAAAAANLLNFWYWMRLLRR